VTTGAPAGAAKSGTVIVPFARCLGCHRPLGLDGEETYRGHHLGCYVPSMDELRILTRGRVSTDDVLVAPPGTRRVGP
jgi:hypothetical protein